jgi:acyl dehydratase
MNQLSSYDIENLHAGMRASSSRPSRMAYIVLFVAVWGNDAIHINEGHAATTRLNGRIAHGFPKASVIRTAATRPDFLNEHAVLGAADEIPCAGASPGTSSTRL